MFEVPGANYLNFEEKNKYQKRLRPKKAINMLQKLLFNQKITSPPRTQSLGLMHINIDESLENNLTPIVKTKLASGSTISKCRRVQNMNKQ